MNIGKIIKVNNPKSYEKLSKIRSERKNGNLTERDIKELMNHSSYRRNGRGAIKQVR